MGKPLLEAMEEIEVVLRKFGDAQSTLLDQFERLSFEVQLNQAILGRSLSEPSVVARNRAPLKAFLAPIQPTPLVTQTQVRRKGLRGSGFNKVLKKLIKPFLPRKGSRGRREVPVPIPDPKNPWSCRAFSRSVRV